MKKLILMCCLLFTISLSQYLYIYNGSAGDVEVLLNADGTPLLYESED